MTWKTILLGRRLATREQDERIAELFDAAGLSDARSHDLRRTFGSAIPRRS